MHIARPVRRVKGKSSPRATRETTVTALLQSLRLFSTLVRYTVPIICVRLREDELFPLKFAKIKSPDECPTNDSLGRLVNCNDVRGLYIHASYERGCQEKKLLPAPLRDAGAVTYIQPHLIPHLILRGVIGLVALARRIFPWQSQPQLLVPTRRFHEVSGARCRSVPKLRKLSVGLSANQDPM
jgi:hypothetical protein